MVYILNMAGASSSQRKMRSKTIIANDLYISNNEYPFNTTADKIPARGRSPPSEPPAYLGFPLFSYYHALAM